VLFFGGTQVLFFSVLTWLAPLYVDLGWSAQRAGFVLTAFTVAELGGSLGSTFLANGFADRRPPLALMLSMSATGLAGAGLAPLAFPWGWAVLMGIGIGGTFALALTLPVDHAASPEATERLTAMTFGIRYTLAAVGPYVVGWLRSTAASFRTPFVVLATVAAVLLVASVLLRPTRTIDI
jgi:CP family cyanate transporter-like MFS transporter